MQKMVKKICDKNVGLLIMRIGLGGIFIFHGTLKLVYMSTTVQFFTQLGFGPFWAWVVALVEVIAGLMILVGVFTWAAGLLLAIIMLVAIFRVKLPWNNIQAFMAGYVLSGDKHRPGQCLPKDCKPDCPILEQATILGAWLSYP